MPLRGARLVIISCVIAVLAYFALAGFVVVRSDDVQAVADAGRVAADLIRALMSLG
jgi:hypothetical protein